MIELSGGRQSQQTGVTKSKKLVPVFRDELRTHPRAIF